MGNALRIIGPARLEEGILLWKQGGPLYEVATGAGTFWVIREVGKPFGLVVDEGLVAEAGYLEVQRAAAE